MAPPETGAAPLTQEEHLGEFLRMLTSFEPPPGSMQILHAETIREFNALIDLRRTRFHMASVSIPGIMWYTVVTGAILCMILIWLFDTTLMSQFKSFEGDGQILACPTPYWRQRFRDMLQDW